MSTIERIIFFTVLGVLMLIALVGANLLLSQSAWAHDWYPPYCCSGEDCKPIAGKDVWFDDKMSLWMFNMNGSTWAVPPEAIHDDSENPGMGAHGCVLWGKVRCFWKPKGGV